MEEVKEGQGQEVQILREPAVCPQGPLLEKDLSIGVNTIQKHYLGLS